MEISPYSFSNAVNLRKVQGLSQKLNDGVTPDEFQQIDKEINEVQLYVTEEEKQKIEMMCNMMGIPAPVMKIKPGEDESTGGKGFAPTPNPKKKPR
ncbi:MAG: hypothetical protein KME46_32800 [Brasilonema angustatum HA4187-MV1]|jgi:hypothetical protein|nr:hypothetical protein [Brasilonema angustatum HA4187-MV1]